MIRQEPKLHFLYPNVDLNAFCQPEPVCQEVDFVAFEDMHAKCVLRIDKNADLEIRLRRDGPTADHWLARGIMKIVLWNEQFEIDGAYPATFCNEKPFQLIDLMSRKALRKEIGDDIFNVEISIKFDKWEGLKVMKLFQFDHRYLDSNLNLSVQGVDFYVRSKTLFKEIPGFRQYLEMNFEPGTKKYELIELQGEKSVNAFNTMLQLAFRCTFITNIHEVGELLTLAYRFNYPALKQKCEWYLLNEPETDWMQKLVFADMYNLTLLKQHVFYNTVGLAQVYKNLDQNRFLETSTLRTILSKCYELKKQKQYEDAPSTGWKPLRLAEITENRWGRMKRIPCETTQEPDVTASFERFEATFMPKHFGVELITPEFSFAEQTSSLFSYKIQLGPDHRILYKIEWNNIQTGNFVWSVFGTVHIRMNYLGTEKWAHSERVQFDHDNQSIFFEGLPIHKVFPGGVEHLLDGLGCNPTLPKVEIIVVVDKIKGLELMPAMESLEAVEEMDDEWILQPSRTHPIVCCGKFLYVDKEVLRSKSRVFTKIFQQTYEPITIPVSFDKFESFDLFLDILHGEDVNFDYQNVFGIIELARAYEVEEVLLRGVDWVVEEPTVDKLEKLELADKNSVPELQKYITDSIVDIDELFAMFKYPNRFERRMLQILQDRMISLPIPCDEMEDPE
ncbi:hypothetical protein B9Z55_016471 [Caenorhabditis nigoni]|uniref:BTB domain-containing protein n=1 Tax=Caenorhabditis nigoni TaxID=1611254 RepID=A0A2G5T4Q5_9PELO|nr:hypothetical protein B9Z55_016471 [Caenorhabditis nigoni]